MSEYAFSLIPYDRLTWVSAYDRDTLCKKIATAVYRNNEALPDRLKFNGVMINESEFRLSQRVSHPNLFLPLLHCRIEPTSSGCLVFVECSLFFGTQAIVAAGLLFLLAAVLFFLFVQPDWLCALAALVAVVLFYLTVLANFHLQKQISLNLLRRVID